MEKKNDDFEGMVEFVMGGLKERWENRSIYNKSDKEIKEEMMEDLDKVLKFYVDCKILNLMLEIEGWK